MPIFSHWSDYTRFLKTVQYYQVAGPKPKFSNITKDKLLLFSSNPKIVEIICYCLMPNHFHFLLRQLQDGGVSEFISKVSNSYTKYVNTKQNRVGPLLQGEFKAVLVESDDQLIHVNRYIHLNPVVSFISKDLESYPWSSYLEYIDKSQNNYCSKEEILSFFPNIEAYKQFVLDQQDYAKTLEQIKHLSLD